jgi:hypothetical protein
MPVPIDAARVADMFDSIAEIVRRKRCWRQEKMMPSASADLR